MRIAIAQTPGTELTEWRRTLEMLEQAVNDAAQTGAELVVMPEGAFPAYNIGSPQALDSAIHDGMPSDDMFLDLVTEWAVSYRIAICVGFIAHRPHGLANVASLVDRRGVVRGTHQKVFLWDFDHDLFLPGQVIVPIKDHQLTVGVMICADARLPEIPATLAKHQSQILLQPTAWVNVGTADDPYNPQADFLARARSMEFGVPIVSASKWGHEGDVQFVGQSQIRDARGHVLALASSGASEIIYADVDVALADEPQIEPHERAGLLSETPPMPPSPEVAELHVAVVGAETSPEELTRYAVDVLYRAGDAPAILTGPGALEYRADTDQLLVVNTPDAIIRRVRDVAVAAVSDREAARFAPIRLLALRGVHVVVVLGDDVDPALLQARALENRIIVLAIGPTRTRAYGTNGRPLSDFERLPARDACNKEVAPHSDMLSGRVPREYDL